MAGQVWATFITDVDEANSPPTKPVLRVSVLDETVYLTVVKMVETTHQLVVNDVAEDVAVDLTQLIQALGMHRSGGCDDCDK